MTFVVETGNADPTATSYVSVEYADAYHSQFGNTDWTDDSVQESDKQNALNIATRACDTLYGPDYKSYPYTQDQILLFPRLNFYINYPRQLCTSNTIPWQLQNAVCELALISLNGGNVLPDINSAQNIRIKRTQAGQGGGVLIQKTFSDSPTEEYYLGLLNVERILRPVLNWDAANEESASFTRLGR